jgi:hypothetical protein
MQLDSLLSARESLNLSLAGSHIPFTLALQPTAVLLKFACMQLDNLLAARLSRKPDHGVNAWK